MNTLMKGMLVAALLLSTPVFAEEAHHKPAEAAVGDMAPQTGATGMMGGDMMKMMGQMMGAHSEMIRGMVGAGEMGMGEGGPMRQMMSPEHVEGRIAFLRTELKVTDAQQRLWDAVANALRENSAATKSMMGGMMPPDTARQPLPQRLADLERMLSARLDGLRRLKAALEPFYASIDETQKKTADELLMPMGMM